jgi:hypothetical protein
MSAEAWSFWKELLILAGIIVLFVGQRFDKRRTRTNSDRNDEEHKRNYDEIRVMRDEVLVAHKQLLVQNKAIARRLEQTDTRVKHIVDHVNLLAARSEKMEANQDVMLGLIAEVDGSSVKKKKEVFV